MPKAIELKIGDPVRHRLGGIKAGRFSKAGIISEKITRETVDGVRTTYSVRFTGSYSENATPVEISPVELELLTDEEFDAIRSVTT